MATTFATLYIVGNILLMRVVGCVAAPEPEVIGGAMTMQGARDVGRVEQAVGIAGNLIANSWYERGHLPRSGDPSIVKLLAQAPPGERLANGESLAWSYRKIAAVTGPEDDDTEIRFVVTRGPKVLWRHPCGFLAKKLTDIWHVHWHLSTTTWKYELYPSEINVANAIAHDVADNFTWHGRWAKNLGDLVKLSGEESSRIFAATARKIGMSFGLAVRSGICAITVHSHRSGNDYVYVLPPDFKGRVIKAEIKTRQDG